MKKLLSLFTALPLVAILMFSPLVFAGTGDLVVEGKNVEVSPKGISYGASYFPDYNETNQGGIGDGKSTKDYIDTIAANSATLVFQHNSGAAITTYTFSTSETIPSNINVIVEKGAILSIAVAQTFTINGPFDAGLYQVFSGAGNIAGLKKTGFLCPEWFGAVGDYDVAGQTGTDDSVAFQKAIDTIVANNLAKLMLSQSNYYFGSKVNLTGGSFVIEGPSGTDREAGVTAASEQPAIYGAAGLACLFDIGNESTAALGGVEFNGVRFVGDTSGASVESAIKITSKYAGPFWPLTIQRCFFHQFNTAAIYASQATLNYNMAFVSITKSAFQLCEYSILLNTSSANRCYGLYFEDNRCHQGGRIKGDFGSPISIRNNNFEGQTDALYITGAATVVTGCIENNYFEACSGDYIIKVRGGAAEGNNITIRNNYYGSATATDYIIIDRITGLIEDDVPVSFTVSYGLSKFLYAKSPIAGVGSTAFSTNAKSTFCRELPEGADFAGRPPLTATTGYVMTPFGPKVYRTLTSGADVGYLDNFATPMANGDLLVVNVLVNYNDAVTPTVYMVLYDGAANNIVESQISSPVMANQWSVITFLYRLSSTPASPDRIRVAFYPYGTASSGDGCDIAGVAIYKIASANVSAARIVPYFDRTQIVNVTAKGADAAGTNVMSANANALGVNTGFIQMLNKDNTLIYVPYWTNVSP